jgi:predicted RNA-binding protein Jag
MKRSITAKDVEDIIKQGINEIEVDEDTIVTDVAREKASTFGIRFVQTGLTCQENTIFNRESPFEPELKYNFPSNATKLSKKPTGCLHDHMVRDRENEENQSIPEGKLGSFHGSIVDRLVHALRGKKS